MIEKILSLNVGIWTRNRKKSDPFYWKDRMKAMKRMLEDQDPDIICFQELWFPANLFIPKKYKKIFGTGLEHPIYIKKGLKHGLGKFSYYWSMVKVEGMRVFSIHGHWDKEITESICDSVKGVCMKDSTPAILAGDWNVECKALQQYVQPLTSAREDCGLPREVTYVHFHDPRRAGEIDHFILYHVCPKNYGIVHNGYGSPDGRISDHYPIIVSL